MHASFFVSMACVMSSAMAAGGSVEGVVKLAGEPPAATPRPVTQDKEACGVGDSVPDDSLVVDKATKGIQWAVVLLEPAAGGAKAAPAAQKIVFDQKHCLFSSHVLVVTEKSEVELKNSDTVAHNVNIKAVKNKGINKTISGNESITWTADREEKIPVECNVHPWMKGWIVVTDAPYHAVTDAQGNFRIENVPAGTYKVKVWQEKLSSKKNWEGPAEITVKDGAATKAEFKGTLGK